jgi:hypothetical protein
MAVGFASGNSCVSGRRETKCAGRWGVGPHLRPQHHPSCRHAVRVRRIALDFLQLFTVVFKPSDGWVIKDDLWWVGVASGVGCRGAPAGRFRSSTDDRIRALAWSLLPWLCRARRAALLCSQAWEHCPHALGYMMLRAYTPTTQAMEASSDVSVRRLHQTAGEPHGMHMSSLARLLEPRR